MIIVLELPSVMRASVGVGVGGLVGSAVGFATTIITDPFSLGDVDVELGSGVIVLSPMMIVLELPSGTRVCVAGGRSPMMIVFELPSVIFASVGSSVAVGIAVGLATTIITDPGLDLMEVGVTLGCGASVLSPMMIVFELPSETLVCVAAGRSPMMIVFELPSLILASVGKGDTTGGGVGLAMLMLITCPGFCLGEVVGRSPLLVPALTSASAGAG